MTKFNFLHKKLYLTNESLGGPARKPDIFLATLLLLRYNDQRNLMVIQLTNSTGILGLKVDSNHVRMKSGLGLSAGSNIKVNPRAAL